MAERDFIYRPATRGDSATLTMFAGPSGSGKTYSALRYARGLAGPEGKICVADTEHGRARFYADEFKFEHLALDEPFRPSKFEAAAIAAQKQGALVWVCDSFSHEHTGPGGLLDFFEEELARMVANAMRRNQNASEYELRNAMQYAAWIKPKGDHKHMLQRLWQMNCHIVLCCTAERKIEMKKVTKDGRTRTEPVDKGLQPICGSDIPYAMTMSFLFQSIENPGVPTVIKPLMPALRPLIDLSKPIDEATGARIAAWARGQQPATSAKNARTEPEPPEQTGSTAPPTEEPPPPSSEDLGGSTKPKADDEKIANRLKELNEMFAGTKSLKEHQALFGNREVSRDIEWLKKSRKELFESDLLPAINASFQRNQQKAGENANA